MKKIAAALIGAAVVVSSGLLFVYCGQKARTTGDADIMPRVASESHESAPPTPRELQVAELAQKRTASAREELLRLYRVWARKAEFDRDRRAIVRRIIENEQPSVAVDLIVDAVSSDGIPIEDDRLFDRVASDMRHLWKDAARVAEGRDTLRLNKSVKGRALLAESLSLRIDTPGSDLPSVEMQREHLASDLMQVYLQSQDEELRHRLLRNVEMVAGADVAEVLANPHNPESNRLAQKLDQSLERAAAQARSLPDY